MGSQTQTKRAASSIDLDEAYDFLEALAPGEELFDFQTFDENPDRELKDKRLAGRNYDSLKNCRKWLTRVNGLHAGVFVALNATDGRGRKKANVTNVRSLMLDLDGAPLEPVLECTLQPHIITETSEGRYHAFWRMEDLPLDQFVPLQRGLARRFDGDPAVATLERCTRLPGFFHCKDIENRFRTRIVEKKDRPPYTAADLAAEFPAEAKPHRPSGSGLFLPAGAPLAVAEEFVLRTRAKDDNRLLHHYRGAFYDWTGTHYRELPDEALESELYAFLRNAMVVKADGTPAPYNPTKGKVGEIVHALRRALLLDRDIEAPLWLEGDDDCPPPDDLVVCENGILNLQTRELIPHDPRLLAMNCLPLEYDRKAKEPHRWYQFLEELWPDDEEAEDCLQEIFGYLLTADTRQHKAFIIIGPGRSGKGTIVSVLHKLIGSKNVVYQTLKSLQGEFGRWPLIDKKLAVVADARLGPRADAHAVAESLLSISGGDPQTINRKNRSFWTGYLGVRFLITTNEVPAIADASGTLPTRFILLRIRETFMGREDLNLKAKLIPELPGILNWALDGLDHLRNRGHFVMPKSSRDDIRQMEELASPIGAFIRDWCRTGPEVQIGIKELYAAYRLWAQEAGQRPSPNHVFGKGLRAVVPYLATKNSGAARTYVGVELSEEGEEQYDDAREQTRK